MLTTYSATLSIASILRPPGDDGNWQGAVKSVRFAPNAAVLAVAGGRIGNCLWTFSCRPSGFSDDPSGLKAVKGRYRFSVLA
jgi:hypothetical protein